MISNAKQRTQRTVKAFDSDIDMINQQAKRLGCSAAEVIHEMCEALRKHVYLQELGESFELVRANAKQFEQFQAEHKLWDCALEDGLNDAP
jgi:uncharacterized protein YaaN involved in tellurite resistance